MQIQHCPNFLPHVDYRKAWFIGNAVALTKNDNAVAKNLRRALTGKGLCNCTLLDIEPLSLQNTPNN